MYAYQKAILEIYPQIDYLTQLYQNKIESIAVHSYGGKRSAAEIYEELIELMDERSKLFGLQNIVRSFLSECSEEERVLLEYRCFHRSELSERIPDFHLRRNESAYFRKQNKLESKIRFFFQRNLYTESWFLEYAKNVRPVMHRYAGALFREESDKSAKSGRTPDSEQSERNILKHLHKRLRSERSLKKVQ